jgi:hypothetical protein
LTWWWNIGMDPTQSVAVPLPLSTPSILAAVDPVVSSNARRLIWLSV